jgi:hypothetical protein
MVFKRYVTLKGQALSSLAREAFLRHWLLWWGDCVTAFRLVAGGQEFDKSSDEEGGKVD